MRRAVWLAVLLTVPLLLPLLSTSASASASIVVDTTWSGDVSLTSDVVVEGPATLTLEPGTVLDADTFAIEVVNGGTLVLEGAQVLTTATPLTAGSHGSGLWPGITVDGTSEAWINDSSISGAEGCLVVEGVLNADGLVLEDCMVGLGVDVGGTATVQDLQVARADVYGVRNEGVLDLVDVTMSNVSIALMLSSTTTASGVDLQVALQGVKAVAGADATLLDITSTDVRIVFGADSGASLDVQQAVVSGADLVVDASDADALSIHDLTVEDSTKLVQGVAVQDLLIENLTATLGQQGSGWVSGLELPCAGACVLRNASLVLENASLHTSGAGTTTLDQVTVRSTLIARPVLQSTGTGTLVAQDLTLEGEGGLLLRDVDTELNALHVDLGLGAGPAVDVMAGSHAWGDVVFERRYRSNDLSSVGLDATYTSITTDALTSRNLSFGARLDVADLTAGALMLQDGKNAGLMVDQGQVSTTTLSTRLSPDGVVLVDASLHVGAWDADRHALALDVDASSTAVVRDFDVVGGTGAADALGDGHLLWGGDASPQVQTSTSDRLIETPVTFTDLDGNPIVASIAVHGFALTSDVNGAATVPLLQGGSDVVALAQGAGVRDVLYGGQNGQRMQLPLLPQGDWVLSSGVDAVLGPRPDGGIHELDGDLTVRTGARLTLLGTHLFLTDGHSAEVEQGGTLLGADAALTADGIDLVGSATVAGTNGGDLHLHGDVGWSCSSPVETSRLHLHGSVTLAPMCEVSVLDGSLNGTAVAQTGAQLELLVGMEVHVLDVGQPVQGANVIVAGDIAQTDSEGSVTGTTSSLLVDESGTSSTGVVMVRLDHSGRSDSVAWDTSGPLVHTFMSSTLEGGSLLGWTVLESKWSPYYLDDDLTVASTGTLTLLDGSLLRIADTVRIHVEGTLDAGDATMQGPGAGARWGGVLVDGDAETEVRMHGTRLLEASPALQHGGPGTVSLIDTTLARSSGADPLLQVTAQASGSMHLDRVVLRDAGGSCFEAQGPDMLLEVDGLTVEGCGDHAVWWRDLDVLASNLTVDAGAASGVTLLGVRGSLEGLNASSHDGAGASLHLQDLRQDLRIRNLDLRAGTASAALTGGPNRGLDVAVVDIEGAPGIDLDDSAGVLTDLTLSGSGTGTAITAHHGRSTSLVMERVQVDGYAVGLDLHAGPDEDAAPVELSDADITAAIALAADGHPASLSNTVLDGEVQVGDADVRLLDVVLEGGPTSVYGSGHLHRWSTQRLVALRSGSPVDGAWTVTPDLPAAQAMSTTGSGAAVTLELLVGVVDATGTVSTGEASVVVVVPGSPAVTTTVTLGDEVVVNVPLNAAPLVTFASPVAGARIMESLPVQVSLVVDDDLEEAADLRYDWVVTDVRAVVVTRSTDVLVTNLTDLPPGIYVIEVSVTDAYGAVGTASLDVEVTQLDTDGDWTSTCSDLTWSDTVTSSPCGPDVYDEDDDGDGIRDTRDAYPMDPCASVDTDEDGQPDDLHCPAGASTWLVADQDDDGDGTPDVLEGTTSSGGGTSWGLVALVVFAVLAVGLLLGRRRGGGGSLSEKDLVHL